VAALKNYLKQSIRKAGRVLGVSKERRVRDDDVRVLERRMIDMEVDLAVLIEALRSHGPNRKGIASEQLAFAQRGSSGRLYEIEAEMLARHPLKSGIFLPTDKIPLPTRVKGLSKVLEIYENRWAGVYSKRLRDLRQRVKARERCFIIGNGPSLNQTDLTKLANEVTFGVNGIFLKHSETGFLPTFYVVEDHLVAEDRAGSINSLRGLTKLFPINLAYCLDEGDDTIFFNHRPRKSFPDGFDFSTDSSKMTYSGCTVTFTCLQLAYYLGFEEIYLVGVDFDYEIPKDVKKNGGYGVEVLDMEQDDPNHFEPDYFGKGFRWHDPQVEKMGEAYVEAKRVCDRRGVKILNATIGGKLEIFPRADYDALFK